MGVVWRYLVENSARGTSDIDWCEPNYVVSDYIAEFYNTISNLPFFFFASLLCYLNGAYARTLSLGSYVVFGILFLIGGGSMYFHATLSLVGQLIDELAILWVVVACVVFWFPINLYPPCFNNNLWLFRSFAISVSIVISVISGILPVVNSFVLMAVIFPIMYFVRQEIKKCDDRRVIALGHYSTFHWGFAIFIWVLDRLLCPVWLSIGFPYLHSFWHILVASGPASIFTLCIYFHTMSTLPDTRPQVRYWPNDNVNHALDSPYSSILWHMFSVPYITLEGKLPTSNNNLMGDVGHPGSTKASNDNVSRNNSYTTLTKEAQD